MAQQPQSEPEDAARTGIYISVFPHLEEFFFLDTRAHLPGGPLAKVVRVSEVLTNAYYDEVSTRFSEILREQRDFLGLLHLPERVAVLLQRRTLKHMLRVALPPERVTSEAPTVTTFIAAGPALGLTREQLDEGIKGALGAAAEPTLVSFCVDNLSRLFDQENRKVQEAQREHLKDIIRGQSPLYYSIWEQKGKNN